jgi:glyoxylase-like metal-dependent hydrolase (beta-lactamase superfamily II)
MLEGVGGFGGGNVGLLKGADGVVMVDDSFPPHTEQLMAAVAKVVAEPVDFVIDTHVHGDHVGGNVTLDAQGAVIVAHDNVRHRLVEEGMPTGGDERPPAPPEMLPVVTFADAVTFHLNGQESYVFHVEHAHTDGDAVIHFRTADIVHAGDVFFNGIFPFIDLDSGGSVDGYIAAQKEILALCKEGTRIIPGHGPLASCADLQGSIAMLEAAKKNIGALIAEGKTVEEILEAAPLADFESQSWQFITTERMIRQVHRGLTQN